MTTKQAENSLLRAILALTIVALAIAIIIAVVNVRTNRKAQAELREKTNLLEAINDTLRISKLENGGQKATILALNTQSIKDFLTIKSKDSTIVGLQKLVEIYKEQLKPGGSVTVVKGETNINAGGKTIVTVTDTVRKDSFIYVHPTYKSLIQNDWYSAHMQMSKDTSLLKLKIINDYSVVISQKDGVWLADVLNNNPYSSVQAMRTYRVSVPKTTPKKFGIGLQTGYGITPLTNPVKGTWYVGVGLSYNLIRF